MKQILKDDDIGRLVVTMRDHRHVFEQRWGLMTNHNRDISGMGTQSITVRSEEHSGHEDHDDNVVRVVFDTTPLSPESLVQYESELFKDGRDESKPAKNLGVCAFYVKSIYYGKGWNEALADELKEHTQVLRKAEASLQVWIDQGWGMLTVCSRILCRTKALFSPEELKLFATNDCSIGELKSRFICKKCGARNPNVSVQDPSVIQPVIR
ncbi:hypothetical protein [Luteimonas sp. FCS-9]|uniref:hypothetical protein n=1 Tax=Luteimonas sp. FCS-9 TaxID=1547516 RepID=UPI0012E094A9|nr:hypothetical protein [Luteimonas sp. FCS-9]